MSEINNVLVMPHLSEKAMILAEENKQFTFKVRSYATKQQIKAAVESVFDVKVEDVKTVNQQGKTKRTRQKLGKRKDWKKAYVALKDGYDLDFSSVD